MTIDKNQIGNECVKPQAFSPRPELGISAKNHTSTQATDDRILSNLGSESITKQPNGRLANNPGIKLFSLLSVSTIAAYAAFLGYQHLSNPASNNTASGAQDHNVPAPQPVVLAAPQAVASSPSMATSAAPEAAQIVNTANPMVASAPAMAPDTLTKTPEDGVPPPTAPLEKALAAKTPTTAPLEPKRHSRPPATHVRTVATATAAPPKAPSRTPEPVVATTDEDVNLLAALIAHSTAAPAPPPKPAVAVKPKTTVKAPTKLEKEKQAAKAKAAAKKNKSLSKNDA